MDVRTYSSKENYFTLWNSAIKEKKKKTKTEVRTRIYSLRKSCTQNRKLPRVSLIISPVISASFFDFMFFWSPM